LDSSER